MAKVQYVFIHRSIKTRIETLLIAINHIFLLLFLYIDPLKQGFNITLTDYTDYTDKRLFILN